MHITKKVMAVAGIAAASALILAGCSSTPASTGGTAATGDPIVVSGISTLSVFPEAPQAAQAVFDEYNAAGGFNGRPIAYTVYDDKIDPAVTATAAKDALAAGSVAMVGSSSLLECGVNYKTWQDNDVVSFQGTGVDPFCFATPNIAPANDGPFLDLYATAWNAVKVDGAKKACVLAATADPATKLAYEQTFKDFESATGTKFAYIDDSVGYGVDYTAAITNLLGHGCDAVVLGGVGPDVTGMISAMTAQGSTLPVYVQTSCYYPDFATGVASYGGLVSVPAEFAPMDDPANADFLALMEAKGVTASSFAQGGYLAAKDFISALERVEGDVTAASVMAAATSQTEADTSGMRGNPWIFGPGESHQANAATFRLDIESGSGVWTNVGPWLLGDAMKWVNTVVPS
ncbi:MAG: ABC transporter substrate-binding protein [Actinomycetales bacterium]|nr:ABC transporter substrate-binding protein [Actinomycetales bacterium]